MYQAVVVLPLIAGLVLLVAGVSKLGRVDEVRAMLRNFRVPVALQRRVVAILVPIVEICIAIMVLTGVGLVYQLGVLLAVAVYVLFLGLVIRSFRAGETFDCGCFGALSRDPVGSRTIVRNALLLGIAVLAAVSVGFGFDGVPAALVEMNGADAAWAAAALLVGITGVVLLGRGAAPAPVPAEETRVATREVPEIEVVLNSGEIALVRDLAAVGPQLLVFVRPGCPTCDMITAAAGDLLTPLLPEIGLIFAVDSAKSVFFAAHPEQSTRAVYGVKSAREKLGIDKIPSAVLLGPNGALLSDIAVGPPAILFLAQQAKDSALTAS